MPWKFKWSEHPPGTGKVVGSTPTQGSKHAKTVDSGFESQVRLQYLILLPKLEKFFNIGDYRGRSKSRLMAEVEKCEVVCSSNQDV